MTIQALGFLDVTQVMAMYVVKHHKAVDNGILRLRDFKDETGDPTNLAILKEWTSARALLTRIRSSAAPFFEGVAPALGRAWIEVVPPLSGTPWTCEADDYAEAHRRTRTCLIGGPGAMSYSGPSALNLLPGIVNLIDHKALCSETNSGDYPRVHLIVDVKIPDAPEP